MSTTTTTPGNAVAKAKEPTQVDIFKGNLTKYQDDLSNLLKIHGIPPEKFISSTITAVKKEPKLLDCDPRTLFGSILVAAELGLPPNTHTGLSFILPYNRSYKDKDGKKTFKKEAQFQLGYQGCIELSLRNPKIEDISTGIIYSNENWSLDNGKREPFSHTALPPSKRGEPIAAYAIAWLKDVARPKVIVLWKEDIMAIANISQGANSDFSPWRKVEADPFKWMWRKTAIKQIWKELPKTREMEKAQHIDNVAETGGNVRLNDENQPEIIETTYMEDLGKQERLEGKGASVAANVKGMRNLKAQEETTVEQEAEADEAGTDEEQAPNSTVPDGDPSKVLPEDVEEPKAGAAKQGKLL